jgi:polyketide biosynthesis enoyl-CoA hydratase PksI
MDAVNTVREGGVATIELCSPQTRNALSNTVVGALDVALLSVGRDPSVRAVVLAAQGPTFCDGAPRSLLMQLCAEEVSPQDIRLPGRLLATPVPIVAAVSGHAVGGGFALAHAADLVVLADECRYGFNFTELGFTPGLGTTRLAEQVLGPALARELLLTGELRRGRGFAPMLAVRPRAQVRAHAEDLARRIADKPRRATSLLKRTLAGPRRAAFEEALSVEAVMHELTFADPATRRRIEENHDGRG